MTLVDPLPAQDFDSRKAQLEWLCFLFFRGQDLLWHTLFGLRIWTQLSIAMLTNCPKYYRRENLTSSIGLVVLQVADDRQVGCHFPTCCLSYCWRHNRCLFECCSMASRLLVFLRRCCELFGFDLDQQCLVDSLSDDCHFVVKMCQKLVRGRVLLVLPLSTASESKIA
jgi:hypothetical protein